MARPARLAQRTHTRFVADLSAYSCRSCIKLIAIPNETIDSDWPPVPTVHWDLWLNRRRRR